MGAHKGSRLLMLAVAACIALGVVACAPASPQATTASCSSTSAVSSASSESSSASDSASSSVADGEGDAKQPQPSSGKGSKTAEGPVEFQSDPAYDELREQVEDVLKDAVIDAGVAFVDLSDTSRIAGFSVNGDTPLVAASMIKLIVLAEFLDEVDAGTISMEELYTVQPDDIVGGTGSIQSAGAGATYPYSELARLMICESDNVAANALIGVMGMDAINAQAEKLGLEGTELVRLMMDQDAIAQHRENRMSAEDAAVLLALIANGQLVSETASAFALEALEAQTDAAGIGAGLPAGVVFAHKTGTLAQVKNDGGIVEADKPYVLVVLCSGADEAAALDIMARISSLVYENFE